MIRNAFALMFVLLSCLPPALTSAAELPVVHGGVVAIVSDGRFVVWAEELMPNRFRRYTNLYVHDQSNGTTRTLAEKLNSAPYIVPMTPSLAINDGLLVWDSQTVDGPPQGLVTTDLRTGATSQLSGPEGRYPTVTASMITWWEYPLRPDVVATIYGRDRAGGQPHELVKHRLPQPTLVRDLQANDNWLIWLQGSYDAGEAKPPCWNLYALSIAEATYGQIVAPGCAPDGVITIPQAALRDTTVALANAAGTMTIYDMQGHPQSSSATGGLYRLISAGPLLFWVSNDPERTLWGYDPHSDSAFPVSTRITNWTIAATRDVLIWNQEQPDSKRQIVIRAIADLLPSARRSTPATGGSHYFKETGHTLGGEFLSYWQRNGGLPVFGFPLTEEFVQRAPGERQGYTVQYFERQRYEFHPDQVGTPYAVQLGRLGAEALATQGRDWQQFPKADPATPHYYAATGQAIAPEFWDYWRTHGLELGDPGISEREALALWGFPISPPQLEDTPEGGRLLVQWFERARFEYHPSNPAPYQVLLGRLGVDQVPHWGR